MDLDLLVGNDFSPRPAIWPGVTPIGGGSELVVDVGSIVIPAARTTDTANIGSSTSLTPLASWAATSYSPSTTVNNAYWYMQSLLAAANAAAQPQSVSKSKTDPVTGNTTNGGQQTTLSDQNKPGLPSMSGLQSLAALASMGTTYSGGSGIQVQGGVISARLDTSAGLDFDTNDNIAIQLTTDAGLDFDSSGDLGVQLDSDGGLQFDGDGKVAIKPNDTSSAPVANISGVSLTADGITLQELGDWSGSDGCYISAGVINPSGRVLDVIINVYPYGNTRFVWTYDKYGRLSNLSVTLAA
jgi:hypothetical protein